MRSVFELIQLVQDGEVNSIEQGRAVIEQEVQDRVNLLGTDETAARDILRSNIGYNTGYGDNELGDKVMEFYECEHPIFGKTHPTPEEALRMGIELGEKMRAEKEGSQ
jgi:hypothetical protein